MENITVREIKDTDKEWMKKIATESFGSEIAVASKTFNVLNLPGFVCEIDGKRGGFLTYHIAKRKLEIVSINSVIESKGVGSALIEKAKELAAGEKLKSVWLLTTNDNIKALKFYQKRGFRIIKVHRNAWDKVRKIKPYVPMVGDYGIPLKDALELEFRI
jgi:N-acetylglutamate synthase-like GNAT family acetyltransferase